MLKVLHHAVYTVERQATFTSHCLQGNFLIRDSLQMFIHTNLMNILKGVSCSFDVSFPPLFAFFSLVHVTNFP
jgi:hypothetical protein